MMNNLKTRNDIIKLLDKIENKNNQSFRKAVITDFITNDTNLLVNNNKFLVQQDKVKRYRIQGEFGEKKFIKP